MSIVNTKKKKIILVCIVIVLAAALIIGISVAMRYKNYHEKVDALSFTDIDVSALADGVYVGECNVDVIYAKVEVTVADSTITGIEILEHRNERGGSAEAIIDDILREQRLDVDAVTSATNSSKVIRKAIENAVLNTQ